MKTTLWMLCFLLTFSLPASAVTLFLAGDSTMSDKPVIDWPETGWGMPFKVFFNDTLTIENHAKNGRSTRSFIREGRWQAITDKLKAGDYVIIQFGHNDESEKKVERYTTPAQYQENLTRFVTDVRRAGATPIILSPVSRRRFEGSTALETHAAYSPLAKKVATDTHTLFIDADSLSRNLYQTFGAENSRLLFLQLKAGEHPNYPEGIEDNTHFNELGARLIAQMMLAELRKKLPTLESYIVRPQP